MYKSPVPEATHPPDHVIDDDDNNAEVLTVVIRMTSKSMCHLQDLPLAVMKNKVDNRIN